MTQNQLDPNQPVTFYQLLADSLPSEPTLRIVEADELFANERSFVPFTDDPPVIQFLQRLVAAGMPLVANEKGWVF